MITLTCYDSDECHCHDHEDVDVDVEDVEKTAEEKLDNALEVS
jgi:hypothetical protein